MKNEENFITMPVKMYEIHMNNAKQEGIAIGIVVGIMLILAILLAFSL